MISRSDLQKNIISVVTFSFICLAYCFQKFAEAVAQRCYIKKAFNFIIKETLTQVFPCEFCKIFKNTFSYRTPMVATSHMW